jgi:hypothetical protein
MNQQSIEQYVAGRMSEADAAAFEDYCVENPEFARQVELEQRLRAGLAQVARGSTAEFVRTEARWKIALAASVLLMICAGAVLWQRSTGVQPVILAGVAADTSRDIPSMRLALVRGAANTPELPSGLVRVEIIGLFDEGYEYSVVLDRQSNTRTETVATLHAQHPSSPVTLEILLDGDELRPGNYALHVLKTNSREEPLDLGFVKR